MKCFYTFFQEKQKNRIRWKDFWTIRNLFFLFIGAFLHNPRLSCRVTEDLVYDSGRKTSCFLCLYLFIFILIHEMLKKKAQTDTMKLKESSLDSYKYVSVWKFESKWIQSAAFTTFTLIKCHFGTKWWNTKDVSEPRCRKSGPRITAGACLQSSVVFW